ncbi:MAG: MFS transporter [Candidatus Aminicenantes bacterium]|nr:MAG: MFS transporter [Candidatus Aminicenantes bacterium]
MDVKKPVRLFNRNFFLLWQGQFVSQIGSQAYAIAMMLWVKHETGSASLMGLLMMVSMIPFVVLGPFAGTFADHFSRRKIIIFSDVLSGVPVLTLAFLMFYRPSASELLIVCLFLVSVTLGIIRSFFNPAISASIPDIVPREKVSAANSLNQSSVQISQFIGQGIGGYLFVILGAPLLFLIDGVTYLFSAFSESFIRIPQKIPEKKGGWRDKFGKFKSDTMEGFRFVWGHAGIRALFFAAAFINFFAIPIVVLLPFYVEDHLHATSDWYGYILAAYGFGALIGYGIAGGVKISSPIRSKAVISALVLMSFCLPILSVIDVPVLALVLMILIGVLSGFFNINLYTLLQIAVPSEMRGRVFGLLITLTGGLTPISMGLSGIIADLVNQNIPLIYAVCGITTLLLTIITSFSKNFRAFLRSG